jgi:hypothetical protein
VSKVTEVSVHIGDVEKKQFAPPTPQEEYKEGVVFDEREYDSALRSFKTFNDEQLKSYGLKMYQPNVDPRIK